MIAGGVMVSKDFEARSLNPTARESFFDVTLQYLRYCMQYAGVIEINGKSMTSVSS